MDLVCDLEAGCIPLPDDSVDEIRGEHLLEHIGDQLHAMQELYRVAKSGCLATFVVPHRKAALAYQDPTHKHFMDEGSWVYFSQAHYTFADYGYTGDWVPQSITVDDEEAPVLMTAVLRANKGGMRWRADK